MSKLEPSKIIFSLIAILAAGLNMEPAIRYGLLGQAPLTNLSLYSPPMWAFAVFGLISIVNIVCYILLLFGKNWPVWFLGALALPHAFSIYLCEERNLLMPLIFLALTVSVIARFKLIIESQKSE
ncbi:hypothetical protein [Arenicella chitinivorans]|uniref:hypothetical protein n=1 Tax=Arenicella chitinivorans TaxID=1329800 RepID=UPI001679E1A8|nr:hypothetical protein [Arenicella chitinivorans]